MSKLEVQKHQPNTEYQKMHRSIAGNQNTPINNISGDISIEYVQNAKSQRGG